MFDECQLRLTWGSQSRSFVMPAAVFTAILTGSGISNDGGQVLGLLGASATSGDTGADGIVGDFTMGGISMEAAFIRQGTTRLDLRFDDPFAAGAAPLGMETITLDIETWAAIGTTGNIVLIPFGLHLHNNYMYFGPFGNGQPALIGIMVSCGCGLVAAMIPWLIWSNRSKS